MSNVKALRRPGRLAAAACVLAGMGLAGCNSAGDGFVTGAGLGALGGMAIGSTSGDMGKGTVIGAVIGAIGGAIIGDQNARRSSWHSGSSGGHWVYGGGYHHHHGCR